MKKRVVAAVVFAFLLSTLAFAQKINTDYDRSANFSNYHTYMWEKSPHPARGFWDQRITEAIDKELQAKGLTKVDANPDVWVVYSNSIHDQKEVIGSGYGFPEISRIGAATEIAARAFDGAQVEKALDEFERCVHAT